MRVWLLVLPALVLASASCKREERKLHVAPPLAQAVETVQLTSLAPDSSSNQPGANAPSTYVNDYEKNAYALGEGQTLFNEYNCNTCHASGGGGDIGPPLLDSEWIYGSQPQQVFASIVQGRPRGMPAFGSRLNEHQTWQLVAFVRSLSGQVPRTAAPARDDHMERQPPPNSIERAEPKNVFWP